MENIVLSFIRLYGTISTCKLHTISFVFCPQSVSPEKKVIVANKNVLNNFIHYMVFKILTPNVFLKITLSTYSLFLIFSGAKVYIILIQTMILSQKVCKFKKIYICK